MLYYKISYKASCNLTSGLATKKWCSWRPSASVAQPGSQPTESSSTCEDQHPINILFQFIKSTVYIYFFKFKATYKQVFRKLTVVSLSLAVQLIQKILFFVVTKRWVARVLCRIWRDVMLLETVSKTRCLLPRSRLTSPVKKCNGDNLLGNGSTQGNTLLIDKFCQYSSYEHYMNHQRKC